jgi:hypothetical protein
MRAVVRSLRILPVADRVASGESALGRRRVVPTVAAKAVRTVAPTVAFIVALLHLAACSAARPSAHAGDSSASALPPHVVQVPPPERPEAPVLTTAAHGRGAAIDLSAVPSAHVEPSGCSWSGVPSEPIVLAYDGARKDAIFGFARVRGPARLATGTEDAPASAEFGVFGLHFDLQVPEGGFKLHATKPLGLLGVYDPAPYVALLWTREGGLTVIAKGFDPRDGGITALRPLERAVSCEDVSIERRGVIPRRDLARARGFAQGKRRGRDGERERLPLSATDGRNGDGEAVALLPAGAVVRVHGVSGAMTEVSYDEAGLWHGFVPTSALTPKKSDLGLGYGTGSGGVRAPKRLPGMQCRQDLPLFVRKTGETKPLARVGAVRAGAHVAFEPVAEVESDDDADPMLVLSADQRARTDEQGELRLREGFELVVEWAATSTCKDE